MQRIYLALFMATLLSLACSARELEKTTDYKAEKQHIESQENTNLEPDPDIPESITDDNTILESRVEDNLEYLNMLYDETENDEEIMLNDYNLDCDLSVKPKKLIHHIETDNLGRAKVSPKQGDWLFADGMQRSVLFKWSDGFKTDIWIEQYTTIFYDEKIFATEGGTVVAYNVPEMEKLYKIGPFNRVNFAIHKGNLYIAAHLDDYHQGSPNKDNVILRKYNLDGELIWEQPCPWPQSESGKFNTDIFAAYKNKIFYQAIGHFFAAADTTTGVEIWRQNADFIKKGITGALSIDKLNHQLIIMARWPWVLYAIDLETGKINWSAEAESELTPKAVSDNIIYLSYTDRTGVVAVDAKTGDKIWQYNDKGEGSVSIIIAKDLLIFGRVCTPTVIALNKHTGEKIWQFNYAEEGQIYEGRLTCYDNYLVVDDRSIRIYE